MQDFGYELLDSGFERKLERFGKYVLVRPCAQAVWTPRLSQREWDAADATFDREEGHRWHNRGALPETWEVEIDGIRFRLSSTDFGHLGIFPEQRAQWRWVRTMCAGSTGRNARATLDDEGVRVLNLFAYTGGATLACAAANAHVTHVDAAKGMVLWARENRDLSGLPEDNTRFIIEDAKAFVRRELRRGNHYDGILMDPPSYGRGPNGEVWKLEDELYGLVDICAEALSATPVFFLINGYTTGFSACVLRNITERCVRARHGGKVEAGELALKVTSGGVLPCGTTARWLPDV